MFPLGAISVLGGVLLTVVVGCLALKLGAKLLTLFSRMVPLTVCASRRAGFNPQ